MRIEPLPPMSIPLSDVPRRMHLLHFLTDETHLCLGGKKLFRNLGAVALKLVQLDGVSYEIVGHDKYLQRRSRKQKILRNQLYGFLIKTQDGIKFLYTELRRASLSRAKEVCTRNISCEKCPYRQMFIETFERRFKAVYGFVPDVE